MKHTRLTHENCYNNNCLVCNLFLCSVCNGLEGSLASQCPGRRLTQLEEQAVYKGVIDFRNGVWVWDSVFKPVHADGNLPIIFGLSGLQLLCERS